MGARRYLLNALEEAINARPLWRLSRDLVKPVNLNIRKNGWNRNIGPAHVGTLARVLESEGRILKRPSPSVPNRWEYKTLEIPRSFARLFLFIFSSPPR